MNRPTEVCGQAIRGRIFRDVERLTSFTEDIEASGHTAGSRTLARRLARGIKACEVLGLDEVVALSRLRMADGRPICIEHTFLPPRTWPHLQGEEIEGGPLYRLLERQGERIARSEELLEVRLATAEEAALLGCAAPIAVAAIARVCFDEHGTPVEFTENVLAGERYVFRFALGRRS
jgi:GntR family transcriptional regulator